MPQAQTAVQRIAGQTRIDTAVALSGQSFDSADTVVVTTAADFPDALTAGPLAGVSDTPVLLTWPDELDGGVAAEVARLGASRVVVVGGKLSSHARRLWRLSRGTCPGPRVAQADHLPRDALSRMVAAPSISR